MSRIERLIEQMRGYGSIECVAGNGFSRTYAQLLEECERWQARYDELGVEPGCVIGVRADFTFASIAALIALLSRRVVAALIPRDCDATRCLKDAHAAAFLEFDAYGHFQWRDVPYARPHPLLTQLRETRHGGFVIFTSGSTGRPKAALQSAERFLLKFDRPGRQLRTLALLLFDHIAGLDTLFYTLASGGALVLACRRDAPYILELIESHHVEVLPASPSFLRLLCAAAVHSHRKAATLKVITYGAEPMDSGTLARVNARFPNAQIIQKYGTTEVGSPRSTSRGNDSLWFKFKPGQVRFKVIDDILWIRSDGVMLGYLNAMSHIEEDGWYCTGDLVEVDGEWIKVVGRAGSVINVGGEKVWPTEVEHVILQLDCVRDVAVVAKPHALLGQIVTAKVVLAMPMEPKEVARRVRSHCRDRLAPHKVPVEVAIVAEVMSERQKIQRTDPFLRDQAHVGPHAQASIWSHSLPVIDLNSFGAGWLSRRAHIMGHS